MYSSITFGVGGGEFLEVPLQAVEVRIKGQSLAVRPLDAGELRAVDDRQSRATPSSSQTACSFEPAPVPARLWMQPSKA